MGFVNLKIVLFKDYDYNVPSREEATKDNIGNQLE